MISINSIQEALVTYLKAQATIAAVLNVVEIREDQWNGTPFSYPNVRVAMGINMPMAEANCNGNIFNVAIFINSETSNSKQADDIAAIVATTLHRVSFTQGSLKFYGLIVTQLFPAVYKLDTKAWTAQIQCRGTVN